MAEQKYQRSSPKSWWVNFNVMVRIVGKISEQRGSRLNSTWSEIPNFDRLIICSTDNVCAISVHTVDSAFMTSEGSNAPPTMIKIIIIRNLA